MKKPSEAMREGLSQIVPVSGVLFGYRRDEPETLCGCAVGAMLLGYGKNPHLLDMKHTEDGLYAKADTGSLFSASLRLPSVEREAVLEGDALYQRVYGASIVADNDDNSRPIPEIIERLERIWY